MPVTFPVPDGFQLDAHGRFNGKPMSFWQKRARELLMDRLVRASMVGGSIVGSMVEKRILEIAKAEDSDVLLQTLEERERCQANLSRFVASFASPSKRKKAKKKRARKA